MRFFKKKKKTLFATMVAIVCVLTVSSIWYFATPSVTKGEESPLNTEQTTEQTKEKETKEKIVLINLSTNEVTLRNGNEVLAVLPIVSQGKPGSYYETIGGSYHNDYKIALHFSSIGHVYMPYSVHLFGNYFIHGIPYYQDGTKVSSTYSGGCIRLHDADAKMVYDFVSRGTTIILTRTNEEAFAPTPTTADTFSSKEMTDLMVATISLELLTQDNEIMGTDTSTTTTTRRKLLPQLLHEGNESVSHLYAQALGETIYVEAMNQKAQALGLTNTHFTDVTSPVETSHEDYSRFMEYISTYKSYLLRTNP